MQKLPHWCDEAAFADWEQDTADWPSWETATAKVGGHGPIGRGAASIGATQGRKN